MINTRPDIAFAVRKLSRYTSNPSALHWQALGQVFQYLKGTMDYGLTYSGYPFVIEGYSDANWINNMEDHSSTSGWVFLLGGAGNEAGWLINLVFEIPLWPKPISTISIRCDNATTLAKAYSQVYNAQPHFFSPRQMPPHRNRVNNEANLDFTVAVAQVVADLLSTLTARITDEIRQNKNNGNNGTRRNARRVNTGGSRNDGDAQPLISMYGKRASEVHILRNYTRKTKVKVFGVIRGRKKLWQHIKESTKAVDGVDLDSSDGVALYSLDGVSLDSPSDIPFNSKAWEKSIGDPKNNNFYGYEITQDPKILHGHRTSFDSTPVNDEAILEAQVNARVESWLKDVREEMRAEMRKIFNDKKSHVL
nr:zinc finger, CCHC-type [Tanacetum cinerariifolium]